MQALHAPEFSLNLMSVLRNVLPAGQTSQKCLWRKVFTAPKVKEWEGAKALALLTHNESISGDRLPTCTLLLYFLDSCAR